MTEQDARLREIRMGDTIVWDKGSGQVIGWRSEFHTVHQHERWSEVCQRRYVLVDVASYKYDRAIPLGQVIERRRPGCEPLMFEEPQAS